MFRTGSNFDKLLDKATSHLLMEPDWPSILQLCDLIRQNDVQPKYALASIKKKLFSPNQHTALYALLVLESMVKNCGYPLHEELTMRPFCDTLYELAKTTTHENVRQKLFELIQAWNFAFRKSPKHGALKDTMILMKSDGYKFPTFRESDAMFSADSAPEWADGDVCHRCRIAFGLLQRKHHCRACGQVFCNQCSQKSTTLPKYGIEKEVRVCDACYDQATKPTAASKAAAEKQESELPPEYLNSSLAQQSQTPPRKSDEELREEEELQLAIAISQSEAEAKEKEKEKFKMVNTYKAPIERSPSPVEEQTNPELARYLNRSYWESIQQNESSEVRATSPSAPATAPTTEVKPKHKENGVVDNDLEEFITTLKSQVEIFINRMKSNSSRGRSIANDTSVQTLFLNITAMHSKLLRYIQQHDDSRLHYERLQDKLTQVKDARAALDDLREEHREKLRREAEEAERQRQLQMAHKLEIMRKKKQEYLQYQRQLALQRIQEQEREMQMRQEHQKQQYLMGYMGSNQFTPQPPPNSAPPPTPSYHGYQYGPMLQQNPPQMGHPGVPPQIAHQMPPGPPPQSHFQQMPNYGVHQINSQPMMSPMPGPGPIPMQAPPPNQPPQGQFPQPPQQGEKTEARTAELISFDD
jgi:growth factor-regulated tyrosine kinase substrate